jgi:hypothetical protein
MPLMEGVDLVRRLGRSRLTVLNARAVTNGEHYRRDGYVSRMARSQACLGLYLLGVPVRTIASLYKPTPAGEALAERAMR